MKFVDYFQLNMNNKQTYIAPKAECNELTPYILCASAIFDEVNGWVDEEIWED